MVDGAQQREVRPAADASEVVGVDRPRHDAGEVVVVGEVHLGPDGLLVIVAHPLGLLVHVRGLVVLLPYRRPGVVLFQVGNKGLPSQSAMAIRGESNPTIGIRDQDLLVTDLDLKEDPGLLQTQILFGNRIPGC